MNRTRILPALALAILLPLCALHAQMDSLTLLVVTGGKSFDVDRFSAMFSSMEGIRYDTASKPGVFALFASEAVARYDVVLFYDSYQPVTEPQKSAFAELCDRGIGCVFVHHALVSHQEWPEYARIVGGRYYHAPYLHEGKKYGPSTYRHDQEYVIRIVDSTHPVTRGIADFPIHDEVYINFQVSPTVTPLLTADEREIGTPIGWAHAYGRSRVVYLQPGHDRHAYDHPEYRALLQNALRWVARRRF